MTGKVIRDKNLRVKAAYSVAGFVSVFIVLTLLFFRNALSFGGNSIIQAGDLVQTYYQKLLYVESLRAGSLPLWNPYLYCGYPFLAHPYNGTFYPLNLLFLTMPVHTAYAWIFALHVALSGVFMFFLVRYLVRDQWAACGAALCFMFSGFTATRIWAGHFEVYTTTIWIPLIMLFFLKTIRLRSMGYLFLTAAVLAVQLFAGHTQTFFFTVMMLGLFVGYELIRQMNAGNGFRAAGTVGRFLLCLFFLVMFSAIQLLPTLELIKLSTRGNGSPFFMSAYGSFPPEHIIRFLFPDFFGSYLRSMYAGDPLLGEIDWELTYYVGFVPALTALVVVWKKLNEKTRRIFFIVGGGSLILSALTRIVFLQLWNIRNHISSGTALTRAVVQFFEKVYTTGIAGREVMLIALGVCCVTATALVLMKKYWVDPVTGSFKNHGLILYFAIVGFTGFILALGQYAPGGFYYFMYKFVPGYNSFKWPARHLILCNFALCVLFGYWLKGLARRPGVRVAVLFVVLIDLFWFGSKFFYKKDISEFYPRKEVVAALRAQPELSRVLPLPVVKPGCIFEPSCVEFQANACVPLHLFNVAGYDPMIIRRYHELTNALQDVPPDDFGNTSIRLAPVPAARFMRMLGVSCLFAKNDPIFRNPGSEHLPPVDFGSSCIFPVPGYTPRFTFVRDVLVADNDKQLLALIRQEQFTRDRQIILEANQNPPQPRSAAGAKETAEIRILRYECNRIDIKLSTPCAGYLSSAEVDYPGWQAYCNGVAVALYRANYAFRSIFIPQAGEYTISFIFAPSRLRTGIILFAFGLCSIVFYYIIRHIKRCARK